MNYLIFPLQVFVVYLSLNHPTVIRFPENIKDYIGPFADQIKITEPSNVKNSLFIEPLKSGIDVSLVAYGASKNSTFYINFKHNEALSQKLISINYAKESRSYSVITDNKRFKILDTRNSLLFINKSDKPLIVNEQVVNNRKFISKGPPVFVDGKMVYFQGVSL